MPLLAAISRALLNPATATSWSVVDESQFGLIRGGSVVFVDRMLTLPRETGATMATLIDA